MTGHIILALDPGQVVGYALLELTGKGELRLRGYGVIAQTQPGQAALLSAVGGWLEGKGRKFQGHQWSLCWEGAIACHALPSNKESAEVRGIIRHWADTRGVLCAEYAPSTVKSAACCLNPQGERTTKIHVRQGVGRILGVDWLPKSMDHIPDAIAIGITHAMKSLHWKPAGLPRKTPREKFSGDALIKFHERMESLTR